MVYVILVLLCILLFLFFFCLFLLKSVKKLSNKVCELELNLELEKKSHDVLEIKKLSNLDKIQLREISNDIDDAILDYEMRKEKDSAIKYEEENVNIDNSDMFNRAYEKDILNKVSSTLSAVEICNDNKYLKNEKGLDEVVMEDVGSRVNLNDFIRRDIGYQEEVLVKKEEVVSNNVSFLEEISREIEKELGPQTIELTDYEKEQEENAIISYKELLKVREQLYEINDSKEDDEFINELRNFRNNLS